MNKVIEYEGRRISFVRRVSKLGNVYIVTIPKMIGEKIHRKPVQVTIEVIKNGDK